MTDTGPIEPRRWDAPDGNPITKQEIDRGITCPRCGLTSHHPKDIREGYCGRCHDWTGVLHGRWDRGGIR